MYYSWYWMRCMKRIIDIFVYLVCAAFLWRTDMRKWYHSCTSTTALRLERNNSVARRLFTGDFSTMYTTILHMDLIDRLGQVCDEAWEWIASQRWHCAVNELLIEWTRWGCKWVR